MESVSVIIVNWNTGKLLQECLESIEKLPERSVIRHVIIVDNASTDTSLVQTNAVADRAGFTILVQTDNLGFAKANNIGINYVQTHGGEHDHILLLNPDTQVHSGAIQSMLAVLHKNPKAGIVGPKLLEPNGDVQPSVRSFPTRTILFLQYLKLHRIFSTTNAWKRYMMIGFDYEKEQVVDQVMGAAFLIRNSVIQKLNGLDEAYWIWFEEVDYCKRVKDNGWEIVYTPTAQVMHVQGASFHQLVGVQKTKPLLDSSLRYVKKHLGIGTYATLCLLYPFAIGIALLASLSHLKQRQQNNYQL